MANQLRRFDAVFLLMFGRIVSRTFIILAILAAIADSAWAFRPEEPQARLHTFGTQSIIAGPPPTDGHVDIASHLKGASNKAGQAIGSKSRAWQNFMARTGKGWSVRWNPITGTPGLVSGRPLSLPGAERLTSGHIEAACLDFVAANASLLKVGPGQLKLAKKVKANGCWRVGFRQVHEGVPVLGSRLRMSFSRDDKLVMFGSDAYPDVEVETKPVVDQEQALRLARADCQDTADKDRVGDAQLCILPIRRPEAFEYRLCWRLHIFQPSVHRRWEYLIDAASGELVSKRNVLVYGNVAGTVLGEYKPEFASDAVQVAGFPYEDIRARGLEVDIASWNFDSDPGWTADGQWAFGTPISGVWSLCSDPNSGYTGNNVYGYNLEGDYYDGMAAEYLTTTAIDCSGFEDVHVIFMRWLGVESSWFDNASIEASNDGVNWTTVWANDESAMCDERWVEVSYDISAVAALEPAVYIRWVMGPTDGTVTFGGWNIDDVRVVSVLGGLNIAQTETDGSYSVLPPWNPSSITSKLEGLYCDINHDCEWDALLEQPGVVPGDVVDFTWDSMSYNHVTEPSVYWHTNWIHDYYVALDPNLRNPSVGFPSGLDYPMPVTVQAWCPFGYCNAYWDGRGMTFGAGDGEFCDDFGLYADVVYHEYTHGVTSKIYGGVDFPYAMEPGAMNEGWSDYFACVLSPSQSPLVGDGGLALDRPEGIRSLESTYRRETDFTNGVHFDSQMFSSSLWQVRQEFERQGQAETWDQMVHFTRYAHALTFEEYLLALVVDDDARFGDSYLANGTPHGQAIYTAFGDRGIGGLQYVAPSVVIADMGGNSNGDLEPGETVNLSLSLRNEWADATQLSAKLSSSDPFVSVHRPVAGFADIEYGGTTDNSADPFVVSLDPSCLGTHTLNFLLEVTANGPYTYERKCFLTYPVGVGQLRYDDGQVDSYVGFVGPPGCALAVRVTPGSYPCYPTRVRLSPYPGVDYTAEVTLWDDDGPGGLPGTVLGTVQVDLRGDGDWFDVDISSLGLCIETGSFYAGWVQGGKLYYNGVDTDPPYYDRSWIYFYWGQGGEWVPFSDTGLLGNLMVRVRYLDTTAEGPVENLTVGRKYGYIQHAIDEGDAGDEIVVSEGVYGENIDFRGKNLTVRSKYPDDQAVVAAAIIDGGYSGPAMRFDSGEDSNCVVAGLTIIGGSKSDENDGGISCLDLGQTGPVIRNCVVTENRGPGIYANNSSPTVVNCDIVENEEDGVRLKSNSYPKMANCTIARNERNGIAGGYPEVANCTIVRNAQAGVYHSRPVIANSIVRDNAEGNIDHFAEVTYSNIEGSWPGLGNIDTDPCFADPNTGDYRLKSWAGRWDPNQQSWVYDASTSLCVDAGNPGSPLVIEANHPENVRVNMGTYGGTAQASRTPAGWSLLPDLTNDGTVDFADLRYWVQDWLSTGSNRPADLDRNAMASMPDWALFAQDWLAETIWHE